MPSLNRRVAARRLAWGAGPQFLTFTPAAPIVAPTLARQAEAEEAPVPAPSLVLRCADELEGSVSGELAVLPAIDPDQSPAPLAVIHADGSRDGFETAESTLAAWTASRSWVRLRSQASHLRVYAGEAAALALRQA